MRPFNTSRGGRRGTITVIVVAFLVLFFIMALTFAFYSIAEADAAKVYKDSGNLGVGGAFDSGAPPDQEGLYSSVMGDVIFGPPEGLPGAFNVLRGHDIARLIYGYDPSQPTGSNQAFSGIGRVPPPVIYPQFTAANPAFTALPAASQAAIQQMINYQWLPNPATVQGLNGMLYEIDNNIYRHPITGAQNPPPPVGWGYRSYAKNANYTYPDLNNLFLGAIDPKSGKVLMPSYHRPYLLIDSSTGIESVFPVNPTVGPVAVPPAFVPADTNAWTSQAGRLLMLRPRPVDHQFAPGQSYFLYPNYNADGTSGDVENLPGKANGRQYDSYWIDPDLPVRRWQGKNYKPLFAMLIVDLDGRINVNTAGNFTPLPDLQQPQAAMQGFMPPQYGPGSNQGFGPWEVNLAAVMPTPVPPAAMIDPNSAFWVNNEAAVLSRKPMYWTGPNAIGFGTPAAHNRFGGNAVSNNQPDRRYRTFSNENLGLNTPVLGSGVRYPFYAQTDSDGRAMSGSGFGTALSQGPNPRYHDLATGHDTNLIFGQAFIPPPGAAPPRPHPDSRYGNALVILPGVYNEHINHVSMYAPYLVKTKGSKDPSGAPDGVFGAEEMRILNEKYNYGNYDGSRLAALAPNTLGQRLYSFGSLNSRFAVTTVSNDLNQPGASPWITTPNPLSYILSATLGAYPSGTAQPFAPTSSPAPAPGAGDHDASYRARLAQLGAVDMNRKLTEYRAFTNQPLGPDNIGNVQRAVADRQALAQDIFERLRYVTTGDAAALPAPGSPNYSALRWMAQLAVNIVDYIDGDDMMTPFNWNPGQPTQQNGWVYGFERPRLEMNETYIRYENRQGDMGVPDPGNPPNRRASEPYSLRAWIELHNPVTPGSAAEQNMDPMGDDGTYGGYRARLEENVRQVPQNANPKQLQSAYRILMYQIPVGPVAQDPMRLRAADNVAGLPPTAVTQPAGWPKVVDFTTAGGTTSTNPPNMKTIQPNVGAQLNGQSFYILGPDDDKPAMGGNDAELPDQTARANLTHRELNVPMTNMDVDNNNRPRWVPGFVLQRLANPYSYVAPYLPTNPPSDISNPYVTIDYLEPDTTAVSIYDHVEFRHDGMRGTAAGSDMRPDLNTTFAWGRRQPYDARVNYADPNHFRQGGDQPAKPMGQVGNHTFGGHNVKIANTWPAPALPGNVTNDTLQQPFLPLNHMDRSLLNPVELMHLVAVKPHELTQSYFPIPGPGSTRLAYTANWLDQADPANLPSGTNRSTFLFRALDYLRVSPYIECMPPGGRIPGRININTQFSTEGFSAVADLNIANRFTNAEIGAAWAGLMGPTRGTPAFQITGNDRPLVGLGTAVTAAGQAPGSNSQDLTLARMNAFWQQAAIEEIAIGTSAGAAQKYELMSKVFNNYTTRSNVFAIYTTIGYFEVMNNGPYNELNRPILGKELGIDDGTVTRHKFFSIVDRTNLTIEQPAAPGLAPKQGQAPVFLEYQPDMPLPNATPVAGQLPFEVRPDPYLPALTPSPTYSQVMVRIPATGQTPPNPPASPPAPPTATTSVSGTYDGIPWILVDDPGHLYPLMLDIGPKAEPVFVRLPPNSFNIGTGTARVILESAGPQFVRQHDRGVALRLRAPDPSKAGADPGNPGPQSGFQYRAPRYAPVIRYAEQLK